MKLQLTNGYNPHFDQITRIMQFVLMNNDRARIPRVEIINGLGMSERQIENLASVAVGLGLLNPRSYTLTALGRAIAKEDRFFERIETLWVIHFIVSSDPQWVVWHRIVNQVIPGHETITTADIADEYFHDLTNKFSKKTIKKKLPKEIGAVLWTYANSELSRLHLLRQDEFGVYQRGSPESIPPLALLVCILEYRERYTNAATALMIKEICGGENSPGMVLNLPEATIRSSLNQLHDTGLIRLEQFGDLDQVRFSDSLTKEMVLQRIYSNAS
jgi:hypothetical protein